MSHVVTAPLVVAHTANGDVYLYAGATVPDSVSEDDLKRLVAEEFVVEVEDAGPEQTEPVVDPLDGLDLADLQAYAAERKIDLGRATTEDGIRTKIREAQPAPQA